MSTAFQGSLGAKVLIRTVTHYYTGRITAVHDDAITLEDAAWIPDTGRFSQALNTGKLEEVEPYPGPVTIMTAAIVDVSPWTHELPREVR